MVFLLSHILSHSLVALVVQFHPAVLSPILPASPFSTEPTADTLSFFLTYRSHSLHPQTLSSYLSGICTQLEVFYPQVRTLRQSPIVWRTLAGIHRVHGASVMRKRPLLPSDLLSVIERLGSSSNFDNQLFLSQLLVGFNQLLCLPK